DGSVATKSGVVDVTTNSAGSLYTTTSLLPSSSISSSASSSVSSSASSSVSSSVSSNDSSSVSSSVFGSRLQEYTTTFVTTNSDGSVATKSGVVDVTTNSAGSLYTTTSSFPPSNSLMGESSTLSSFERVSSVPIIPSGIFTGYHNSTTGTISTSLSLKSFATESESVTTIAPGRRPSSDSSTASDSVTSSVSRSSILWKSDSMSLSATTAISSTIPSTSAQPGVPGSNVVSVSGASGTPATAPASGTSFTSSDVVSSDGTSIDASSSAIAISAVVSLASEIPPEFDFVTKSGTISTASFSTGLIESRSGSSTASGNTANPEHAEGSVVSNSEADVVSVTAESPVGISAVPFTSGTAAQIGAGSRGEAQGASESETGHLSASAASTVDAHVTRTSLPLGSHSSHVVWQSTGISMSVASSETVSTASVEFGNSAGKSGISMAMIIISVIAYAF
ncbi:hypothetical protein OXX80_013352, partial [Metschnikowia pulcherrima]